MFLFTFTLNSIPYRIHIIEYKPPDNSTPRRNLWQRIVKLCSNSPQLWQPRPRNVWKIMVLIVVPNIPCKHVQRPIVRVGLGRQQLFRNVCPANLLVAWHIILIQHIMLSNKVASTWVQRPRQKRAHNKVPQRLPPQYVTIT